MCRPVDESRKHVRLVRAKDVEVRVETLQIYALIGLKLDVSIPHNVLNLHLCNVENYPWKVTAHQIQNVQTRNDTINIRLTSCQHHLA